MKDMDDKLEEEVLEKEIFNLSIFTISSAKILKDEPPSYGPNRLLTVFEKIADLPSLLSREDAKPFWDKVRDIVKNKRELGNEVVIDRLLQEFLKEAKKRRNKSS